MLPFTGCRRDEPAVSGHCLGHEAGRLAARSKKRGKQQAKARIFTENMLPTPISALYPNPQCDTLAP